MNKKNDKAIAKSEERRIVLTADFGKVLVKVRGDEILRPVKAEMTLYERLGHLYSIADKCNITAQGYVHLNKVASISIVTPQTVIVDGVAQPNPYIERNPRTKIIENVIIRKIGIGYSPAGNVVVIDKTLFYNIYTYFVQSIQAKMKRVKWVSGKKTDEKEYPNCAVLGMEGKKPDKPGSWAFFEMEKPLGIWVNYEDQAIIDCLEEHTQRQKFADRIAQKIVERNIMKDHPAIGITQVYYQDTKQGKVATVTIYGYRHDLEAVNISEILSQAESGKEIKGYEVYEGVIGDLDTEEEKAAIEETRGEAEPEEKKQPQAVPKEKSEDFFLGEDPGITNEKLKESVKISLTRHDGKKIKVSFKEALEYFNQLKKSLGNSTYYMILGQNGYEHANQIPCGEMDKVCSNLLEAWRYKKQQKEKQK